MKSKLRSTVTLTPGAKPTWSPHGQSWTLWAMKQKMIALDQNPEDKCPWVHKAIKKYVIAQIDGSEWTFPSLQKNSYSYEWKGWNWNWAVSKQRRDACCIQVLLIDATISERTIGEKQDRQNLRDLVPKIFANYTGREDSNFIVEQPSRNHLLQVRKRIWVASDISVRSWV